MTTTSAVRARPARGTGYFTGASALAAAARGLAIAGFLTSNVSGLPPGIASRWFVIALLLVPGAFAPLLARTRRARGVMGARNVTSVYVLASFFRGGLVCTIPWAKGGGLFFAEAVLFGAVSLAVALLETWLRWTRPAHSVTRAGWFAAAVQLGVGALLIATGLGTLPGTHGFVWFYGGAGLYIIAGVVASFGGAVEVEEPGAEFAAEPAASAAAEPSRGRG